MDSNNSDSDDDVNDVNRESESSDYNIRIPKELTKNNKVSFSLTIEPRSDQTKQGSPCGRGKRKKKDENPVHQTKVIKEEALDSFPSYPLTQDWRGYGLIFNQITFKTLPERHGAMIDQDNLEKLFKDMRLTPKSFQNLSKSQIVRKINSFSKWRSLKNAQMAFIAILSHGNDRGIFASDEEIVDLEGDIYEKLNNKYSPLLRNKPKLFIINACRGQMMDTGICTVDGISEPSYEDMAIIYSTIPRHWSFRNSVKGSWLIQDLVKVFRMHSYDKDLFTLWQMICDHLKRREATVKVNSRLYKRAKCSSEFSLRNFRKKLFFNVDLRHTIEVRTQFN